jgi:trehalose-6-phosphate synthase
MAGGVIDVVSQVNSRFSTLTYQPVVFLHTQDVTFFQYLALLTVADAFLVTSLRDGMALRLGHFKGTVNTYRAPSPLGLTNSLNARK